MPGFPCSHQPLFEVWNLGPYKQPFIAHTDVPWGPMQSPAHLQGTEPVVLFATVTPMQWGPRGPSGHHQAGLLWNPNPSGHLPAPGQWNMESPSDLLHPVFWSGGLSYHFRFSSWCPLGALLITHVPAHLRFRKPSSCQPDCTLWQLGTLALLWSHRVPSSPRGSDNLFQWPDGSSGGLPILATLNPDWGLPSDSWSGVKKLEDAGMSKGKRSSL